jgi:hypothetical protein
MRGIKALHELSLQRQMEGGNQVRPTSSYNFNNEDDQELYMEKLMRDSGRSAPLTKNLIQTMDKQLEDVQSWRIKEEAEFQKQLEAIKRDNLRKKAETKL